MPDHLTKKSLGQHWLNDLITLNAICEAADINASDTILEIGPGQGALTKLIIDRTKQVIAVEIDTDLAEQLKSKITANNLQVIDADIRSYDLTKLSKNYKIVANIPYYLTAYLLRMLTETLNKPQTAVILVQKEVAQRVAAEPGNMGFISVAVQYYYNVSLGQIVPAIMFTPPPKVDSQILILKRRLQPIFEIDTKQFFRLVKAGFSNRRKTLLNSLSAGLRLDRITTEQALLIAGLSPASRAQELSLQDWHRLYKTML